MCGSNQVRSLQELRQWCCWPFVSLHDVSMDIQWHKKKQKLRFSTERLKKNRVEYKQSLRSFGLTKKLSQFALHSQGIASKNEYGTNEKKTRLKWTPMFFESNPFSNKKNNITPWHCKSSDSRKQYCNMKQFRGNLSWNAQEGCMKFQHCFCCSKPCLEPELFMVNRVHSACSMKQMIFRSTIKGCESTPGLTHQQSAHIPTFHLEWFEGASTGWATSAAE